MINIKWSAKNKLRDLDEFTITLPKEFINADIEFDILTPDNNAVGRCYCKGRQLKVIFNKNIENIENVNGNITFNRRLEYSKIENKDNIDLEFILKEQKKNVHIDINHANTIKNEIIEKWGFWSENQQINPAYGVRINFAEKNLKNLIFEDILGEGQKFDESLIELYETKFDVHGESVKEFEKQISLNSLKNKIEDNSMKIYFGDTNKSYLLIYKVNITELKEKYSNYAKLTWDTGVVDKTVILEKYNGEGDAIIGDNEDKPEVSEDKPEVPEVKPKIPEDKHSKTNDRNNFILYLILSFLSINISIKSKRKSL
ncbi:MAG: collagen binding domain-containing protein [Clostridiaceae bacterium]|nr:collagen binding domain-containing protein [Clostridiaceae bacterium]